MSRDAEDGAALYEELYQRGIDLVFLNEPHCNTECYRQAAAASIPATGNEIADIYIEATNRVLIFVLLFQIMVRHRRSLSGLELPLVSVVGIPGNPAELDHLRVVQRAVGQRDCGYLHRSDQPGPDAPGPETNCHRLRLI